ncbi:peptidoglycan-binding domain-containing protein [Clostridium intestinale]|uniref:M15 family peptidase n=2 Tax=Clostridium intestinale TaxID=36845 RepID=U2NQG3_9CLOT|nr:peptidoglycan-binding protein [Clostridium intestinale]ERK31081.1 M15 family peptidase [Clostridium intestinale URNW]QLY81338.1 peptidoglycan-binding protein [Clostridium intestinale]
MAIVGQNNDGTLITYNSYTGNVLNDKNIWNSIYKKGSTGQGVKEIQSILIGLGYDLGSWGADGDFGSKTDEAVRAFQRKQGITVDGIVGPETIGRLNQAISPKQSQPVNQASDVMLSYNPNQYDSRVAEVQRKLGITADGYFGQQTLSAVKSFQASHGLDADGIVGQLTQAKLNEVSVSAPAQSSNQNKTSTTKTEIQQKIEKANELRKDFFETGSLLSLGKLIVTNWQIRIDSYTNYNATVMKAHGIDEELANAGAEVITGELSGTLLGVTINGVKAFVNIRTGEIVSEGNFIATSRLASTGNRDKT